MKDFSITLTAGQRKQLNVSGAFLRVRSATGGVQIDTPEGGILSLVAGDKIRFPRPFEWFGFTDLSGAANTLVVTVGDGDADSTSLVGSVQVSSIIAPPTVAAVTAPVTVDWVEPTGQYFSVSIATSLVTIVTPAANTGGLDVLRITAFLATGSRARFMSKTSAPASINDTGARTLGILLSSSSYGPPLTHGGQGFRIPAGEGFYAQCSSGAGNLIAADWRAN